MRNFQNMWLVQTIAVAAWGQIGRGQATFTPLPFLAETQFNLNQVFAVSGDGRVAAGMASDDTFARVATRWTAGACEDMFVGESSESFGVSYDGAVVVGHWLQPTGAAQRGFVFTESSGVLLLSTLDGDDGEFSSARGVSADGTVVVGESSGAGHWRGFVWTAQKGMNALVMPTEATDSGAYGVSADGSVVVGYVYTDPLLQIGPGCRWVGGTPQVLPPLPEMDLAVGVQVSPEGNVAVGSSGTFAGQTACMWNGAGVPHDLGGLPGYEASYAQDTSSWGGRVVGYSYANAINSAVFWDRGRQARDLRTVLTIDHGIDLSGWRLDDAYGISDDGTVIVGNGVNPDGEAQGWIVSLPPPCTTDVDEDGFVNGIDFDLFVAAFEAGDTDADFDGDGFITGLDFDLYVQAFEAGC